MKVYVAVVALLFTCCCISVSPLLAGCVIEDDEEYAVLAAVLFPNEPDVPDTITDLEREAYRALLRPRMSGFKSSSYTLRNETMRETEPPESRNFIDRDFYEKNKQACTVDGARLRAHVPEHGHVSVVSREEAERDVPVPLFGSDGAKDGLNRRRFPRIMTYLSRPGFNKDRTEAMVEADRQAHPEMGVGYRVYLKKSPKTGQWFITDARRTRVS